MRSHGAPLVLVAVLIMAGSSRADAQSARELYEQAEASMLENEPGDAVRLATQARDRLGSTNPRIEGLLAQAYLAAGDAVNARLAMDKVLRMVPASRQRASSFEAYRALDEQIDRALERAEAEHEEAEAEGAEAALREAEEIAARYEAQRAARLQRNRQAAASQRQALYNRLRSSEDTEAMAEFARTFPDAEEARTLRNRAASIERERRRIANEPSVWADARRANTVSAYENYLRVYPDGRHVANAREGIYQARAAIQLRKARRTNQIADYEEYYNSFPRGADIDWVRRSLLLSYKNFGDAAYDSKNWSAARVYYRNYLVLRPVDAHVEQRLSSVNRMLGQRSPFGMFAVKEGPAWGLILMEAHRDSHSYYFGGRVRYYSSLPHQQLNERFEFPLDQASSEVVLNGSTILRSRFRRTGERDVYTVTFAWGVTQKLVYPLWLSLGITGGYQEVWEVIARQDYLRATRTWRSADPMYQLNDDETAYGVGAEAGLNLYLGPASIHYGANYIFGGLRHYVGIGFAP